MRLFHFSDDPNIATFSPRSVSAKRAAGYEWLNGPLVWAIDDARQPMYLFPRNCPRILLWMTPQTTEEDKKQWWDGRSCRMIAHIEASWFDRLSTAFIYRYELSSESFEDLGDAGMWVSRTPVMPIEVTKLDNLPAHLKASGVELRIMESLVPLKDVWNTSLHASGIRLRNAKGWDAQVS